MKTILALTISMIATVTHAGPSISGGIIHNEQFEACANKKNKTTFTLASVLTPGNYLGTITEGEVSTILKCKAGNNSSNVQNEEIIWSCNEHRAGEGQLLVEVVRAKDGVKFARVYRKDIIQRNVNLYNMKCDQQVSN